VKKYDVIIIGAGIIGLCTAWQLARRMRIRIAVLDKGAGVGEGSTGASSAVCRFRYSLDEMVYLACDGIGAYRKWRDFTGLADARAEFHGDGVLWMPGDDHRWARAEHLRMQRLGVRTQVLDDQALQERFPALSPCTQAPDMLSGQSHDCRGGGQHFLETDGGYMDPVDCCADLVDACRHRGVAVLFRQPVVAVLTASGAVSGVRLADGQSIFAPIVINAAGPWCNALTQELDLDLHWRLAPTRIQVLHLDRPGEVEGHIPATVDMGSGIYFRLQNKAQQIVVGSVLEEDERETVDNPDHFNRLPDDVFLQAKLHALHHRIPSLPYRGKVRGYCGLYTVNQLDVHPLVGETAIKGFYLANGFSGHGFKLAPAVGSLLAQMIAGSAADFDTRVRTNFFSIDRQPFTLEGKSVLA